MKSKTNDLSENAEILCPYCRGNITVSRHCFSMPCRHCNRNINVKEILYPSKEKQNIDVGKRKFQCFKCGKDVFADKNAQAVTCTYCYNRNDLSDHKVKSLMGKNLQTYGTLYLKKKGIIEISSLLVGNAVIEGRVNGDLTSFGTVEILKRGELYGNITCRKLIVKKGGIFRGVVQMLDANTE